MSGTSGGDAGRTRRSGYISRMSVSMVAASAALLRHFAEVVVIRDGPLFIRPLFLLSQRDFHPSSVQPQGGRELSGVEMDPLFRVSHSNATYVREAPVS